jgi:hypothetical protein
MKRDREADERFEEDRPRPRRRQAQEDDDEEHDRPRRRRRAGREKKGIHPGVIIGIVIAVVGFILLITMIILALNN